MSDKPKICKECRFSDKNVAFLNGAEFVTFYCNHGVEASVDVVTGAKSHPESDLCYFARSQYGRCKPEGRLWEGIL